MYEQLSQAIVALAVVALAHMTLWLKNKLQERKGRRGKSDLDARLDAIEASVAVACSRLSRLEGYRKGYENGKDRD